MVDMVDGLSRLAFWGLPGPRGWLEEAAECLDQGIVILDIPMKRRGAVSSAFQKAAEEARFAASAFVEVGEAHVGLPPASAIMEAALDADIRPLEMSPRSMATSADMDGVVAWVEPKIEDWRRWSLFCAAFMEERKRSSLIDPPSLVLVMPPGAGGHDGRIPVFKFEGVMGRDDAAIVLANASRRPRRGAQTSRVETLLRAEVAIELAGWDMGQLEVMAGLPLESLLDPLALIKAVPHEGAFTDAKLGWQAGWLDLFDNRAFPSFRNLAALNDVKAIEHRIWRAEIRGLFPWLEEVRQIVLQKFAGRFRLPVRTYDNMEIRDPEDLDWGQIQYALRGVATPAEMDWLEIMKRVRNMLAHRSPVPYVDVVEADRQSKKFLGALLR